MRKIFMILGMLVCTISSATAQVSVGIGLPGVSVGINLASYPQLVPVPGYPVYYAPQVNSNYFFYDGLYWVYQGDNWYASSWYNGPWGLVAPAAVPLFVLRVPVRYYRRPPAYFHGWVSDAPPRWGDHWGNSWTQSHNGWDTWNRSAVPALAPLPTYQRQYSGNRYPQAQQQQALLVQNYRYQPQEAVVQQHYQAQQMQPPAAPSPRAQLATPPPQAKPTVRAPQQDQHNASRPPPPVQSVAATPRQQPAPREGGNVQMPSAHGTAQPVAPVIAHQGPPPQTAAAVHQPQAPKEQGNDKVPGKEPKQGEGQGKGQDKGEQQGGGHDK
jgi:hypothetical protein